MKVIKISNISELIAKLEQKEFPIVLNKNTSIVNYSGYGEGNPNDDDYDRDYFVEVINDGVKKPATISMVWQELKIEEGV